MLAMVLAMIFGSYTTVVVTMTAAAPSHDRLSLFDDGRGVPLDQLAQHHFDCRMIPMSTALEKVGVVDAAANGLVDTLGAVGPIAVMAGLFVLTTGFTQVISNTATTVIVAPIALTAAQSLVFSHKRL